MAVTGLSASTTAALQNLLKQQQAGGSIPLINPNTASPSTPAASKPTGSIPQTSLGSPMAGIPASVQQAQSGSVYSPPASTPQPSNSGVSGMSAQTPSPASTGSMPQATPSPLKPMTYNEASVTNYGGKGDPYNEILNSKKAYDTGVNSKNAGLQNWAANNANTYYSQLSADEAAKVRGMNTQQLIDYINSKNQPAPSTGTGGGTGTGNGVGMSATNNVSMPNDVLNLRDSKDLLAQSGDSLVIERAGLETAVNERLKTLKNNFQHANQIIQDDNVLNDFMRQQTANPFGNMGRTAWNEGLVQRQRSIDNNYRAADLANQLNAVQEELYNFDKLAPERQRQIYNQLLQMEREFGLQQGQLTGNYGGQRTLAGQQFDHGVNMDYADRTGSLNGQRTLAGQQFDRNIFESDRAYNYQIGRDAVADSQWAQNFAEAKRQYGEQFAYQKARDSITDAKDKRDFEEDVRRFGLDYGLQQQQIRISQQNANTSAANSRADNARASASAKQNQLMDVWRATGKAPAGIDGVPEGTPYYDPVAARQDNGGNDQTAQIESDYRNDYAEMIADKAKGLKELQDHTNYYINKYGAPKYNAMLKAVGG